MPVISTATEEISRVVEHCAWCGTALMPHMQVVIAGGRFDGPSADVEGLRGHAVRVRTALGEQPVTAIVPLLHTPAHAAGYDLLFVLCGTDCRDSLDCAIANEPMTLSAARWS